MADRVGKMIVRGRGLRSDVAEAVLDGAVDLSMSQVSQLSATIEDPDLALLGSRLFDLGGQCDYGALKLAVAAVETVDVSGVAGLAVTARSLGVRKLQRAEGELVRRNLSPTAFAEIEARGAGLRFVGEPSARRRQIARQTGDQAETTWDTLRRLADELGFVCFESAGTLYFGRPTWIKSRATIYPFRWAAGDGASDALLSMPKMRRSLDSDAGAEGTLELVGDDADIIRPGDAVRLRGVPTFDGDYLVAQVTVPLDDTRPVVVRIQTPINPDPNPPAEPPTSAGGSSAGGSAPAGGGGPGSVETFVAAALGQAGTRYRYGAEASASDSDPDAFDCSELVEWAAARAGVKFVDGSSQQRAYCERKGTLVSVDRAVRTRGALLFASGHVAISLGNGRTIEAVNRTYGVREMSATGRQSVRWIAGGLVPGLRYP